MAAPTTAELADHVFSYAARDVSPGWEELRTVLTKDELIEIFDGIQADPDADGHPLFFSGSEGESTYESAIDWVEHELLVPWRRAWDRNERNPEFILYEADLPSQHEQEHVESTRIDFTTDEPPVKESKAHERFRKQVAPKYPAEALTVQRQALVRRVKRYLENQISAEDGAAGRLEDIVSMPVPKLAAKLWREAPQIDTVDEAVQWLVGENPFYEDQAIMRRGDKIGILAQVLEIVDAISMRVVYLNGTGHGEEETVATKHWVPAPNVDLSQFSHAVPAERTLPALASKLGQQFRNRAYAYADALRDLATEIQRLAETELGGSQTTTAASVAGQMQREIEQGLAIAAFSGVVAAADVHDRDCD